MGFSSNLKTCCHFGGLFCHGFCFKEESVKKLVVCQQHCAFLYVVSGSVPFKMAALVLNLAPQPLENLQDLKHDFV